jgi:hypothetical protein
MATSCHDSTQRRYRENPKYKGHYLRLCSARAKRTGQPCGQLAMPNGKCRLHGGRSSGPGNVLFPEAGDKSGERKLRNKLAVVAKRARAKEVEDEEREQQTFPYEEDPALRRELNNASDLVDRNTLARAIREYRRGVIPFCRFMNIRRAVARRGESTSSLHSR